MHGNVFECYSERNDRKQFTKTLEALQEYVKKTVRSPDDMAPLFGDTIKDPTVDEPDDLDKGAGRLKQEIWKEEIKEFVKRKRVLRDNKATVYSVIWGQCSPEMQAKLRSLDEYQKRTDDNDCAWILKEIRAVAHQFDAKRNGFLALLDARTSFLTCRQGPNQSCEAYLETFRGWYESLELQGGTITEGIPGRDEG